MIVYPCSTEKPATSKVEIALSFDDILRQEGIYRSAEPYSRWRVVVIRDSTGTSLAFFVSEEAGGVRRLEICSGVKSVPFIKTEEMLCLEFK